VAWPPRKDSSWIGRRRRQRTKARGMLGKLDRASSSILTTPPLNTTPVAASANPVICATGDVDPFDFSARRIASTRRSGCHHAVDAGYAHLAEDLYQRFANGAVAHCGPHPLARLRRRRPGGGDSRSPKGFKRGVPASCPAPQRGLSAPSLARKPEGTPTTCSTRIARGWPRNSCNGGGPRRIARGGMAVGVSRSCITSCCTLR